MFSQIWLSYFAEDKIKMCTHDIATISSSSLSSSIWSLSLAIVVTASTMAILEVAQQASLITQSLLVTIDIDITTRYTHTMCQWEGEVLKSAFADCFLSLSKQKICNSPELYFEKFYLICSSKLTLLNSKILDLKSMSQCLMTMWNVGRDGDIIDPSPQLASVCICLLWCGSAASHMTAHHHPTFEGNQPFFVFILKASSLSPRIMSCSSWGDAQCCRGWIFEAVVTIERIIRVENVIQ